jgi:hypothetical protein
MANVFTNVGEFRRGKGNKKSRLGPRITVKAARRQGAEKQTQSPNEIAVAKLGKSLRETTSLESTQRNSYINIVREAEQLRFMSMTVLTEVFVYMHNNNDPVDINQENFHYSRVPPGGVIPYIERIIDRKEFRAKMKDNSENERNIVSLRLAATFLRYIQYINILRAQNAEEAKQAEQNKGQRTEMAPPTIDLQLT